MFKLDFFTNIGLTIGGIARREEVASAKYSSNRWNQGWKLFNPTNKTWSISVISFCDLKTGEKFHKLTNKING